MHKPIAIYIRLQNGANVKAIRQLHTYGRLSLLMFFDEYESFLGFRYVKNKARDIRLFHIWCPTTPKERFPEVFPSGFYAAFGVKTMQKYKNLFNLQLFGEEFHTLMHGIRFINDFYRTH